MPDQVAHNFPAHNCLVKTPLPYGVKHFSFEGLGGVWGGVGGGG